MEFEKDFGSNYDNSSSTLYPSKCCQCPTSVPNLYTNITKERVKITIILIVILSAALMFTFSQPEEPDILSMYGVSFYRPVMIDIPKMESSTVLEALCVVERMSEYNHHNQTFVYVEVQAKNDTGEWDSIYDTWTIELGDKTSHLVNDFYIYDNKEMYRWLITTNSLYPLAVSFRYRVLFEVVYYEVLIAALVLCGTYSLIIFDITHRTTAAMLGSFVCLGFVSVTHGRPGFELVINWIDFETIGMLFGMMIMVGIFSETGFFEWSAIKAYKYSKGNVWHLTLLLCVFTSIIVSFLDNVTSILLVIPVTIRLCKVMNFEPRPIILAIIIISNIAGTGMAIGDPSNLIVLNNPGIKAYSNIDFLTMVFHMTIGTTIVVVVMLIFFYFHISKSSRHAYTSLQNTEYELKVWNQGQRIPAEESEENKDTVDVYELETKYVIKDIPLFVSSVVILSTVIGLFFLQPVLEQYLHLSLAWVAIIGAMIHLLVSGIRDVDQILAKVELSTLVFFAGLFVLMKGLNILGLINFIGRMIHSVIICVPAGEARLAGAILLILWVSAFASAIIDNVPYITAMVPVIVSLSESDLGLPLAPLTWALMFGTCFGGNTTLVGASANVVAVSLCEQQGCNISFVQFFKFGFPCMILSVITVSIYLLCSHVLIPWY